MQAGVLAVRRSPAGCRVPCGALFASSNARLPALKIFTVPGGRRPVFYISPGTALKRAFYGLFLTVTVPGGRRPVKNFTYRPGPLRGPGKCRRVLPRASYGLSTGFLRPNEPSDEKGGMPPGKSGAASSAPWGCRRAATGNPVLLVKNVPAGQPLCPWEPWRMPAGQPLCR